MRNILAYVMAMRDQYYELEDQIKKLINKNIVGICGYYLLNEVGWVGKPHEGIEKCGEGTLVIKHLEVNKSK